MMNTEYRTARFHDGERYVTALVRSGRKNLHLTFIDDSGVRHSAPPLEEARYLIPCTRKGDFYPVERMVRKLRGAGSRMGITDAAKAELARAEA
jgi:hypothetical protein